MTEKKKRGEYPITNKVSKSEQKVDILFWHFILTCAWQAYLHASILKTFHNWTPQAVNYWQECSDNSNWQTKPTQSGRVVSSSRFHSVPNALPPFLSLIWEKGLLSALSLGHQAAVVAAATNLRVLGQGGRRRWGKNRRSVGWGCSTSRALALVLVGPATTPF